MSDAWIEDDIADLSYAAFIQLVSFLDEKIRPPQQRSIKNILKARKALVVVLEDPDSNGFVIYERRSRLTAQKRVLNDRCHQLS